MLLISYYIQIFISQMKRIPNFFIMVTNLKHAFLNTLNLHTKQTLED